MIKKISKLKDFGIFHDFSWKAELPEFKKFNLIYGWNRSGKTTISRIFSSCEKKCVYDKDRFEQFPENGEFEIKTSDGVTIKNGDIACNSLLIKVFNQDFINDNISFNSSSSCNPIVYVSEEDVETKKKLEVLKNNIQPLSQKYEIAKNKKESAVKIEDNFRISIAQIITQLLTDKSNHDNYYFYDKSRVKDTINKNGTDNFVQHVLSSEDKKNYEIVSKSKKLTHQPLFEGLKFSFQFDGKAVDNLEKLFKVVQALINKKIVSETLERLKKDQNLSDWVKQGFDLHKTLEEKEKCLFCQGQLNTNFLTSLSKHFNKDYEDLRVSIASLKIETVKLKKEKLASKNNELYPDLQSRYEENVGDINDIIGELNKWIDKTLDMLQKKYGDPLLSSMKFTDDPQTFKRNYYNEVTNAIDNALNKYGMAIKTVSRNIQKDYFDSCYNEAILEINKIITEHNHKADNHSSEVDKAKEKLELHAIATALFEQDYKKIEGDVREFGIKEKEAQTAVNNNNAVISELEKKNSNIGKAIEEINKHLKEFFGRKEIELELDDNKKGYIIKRGGQPAKNLSEGEKTAIAFSYFIVKTEEKEFKIKDGIIFIDDPISSFDSNFIYHCFSLITTHFKQAGQLFISTHNFQLFNLTKEWLINKNGHTKEDNENARLEQRAERPIPCEFFMVENFTESDVRKAKLVVLDKTLRNYKSEYQFLFSQLNKFKDVDLSYADFYTIGNVARRFFDIFADFKIPDSRNQKQKMETVVREANEGKREGEKISDSDWNKAYKLVNEFSHNSDPTSAIEHKDKSECKDAIKVLLKIVKKSDPKHFEILEKNLT